MHDREDQEIDHKKEQNPNQVVGDELMPKYDITGKTGGTCYIIAEISPSAYRE